MLTSTSIILACSGPGAMAGIQRSIVIGYICAAIGALISAWMVRNCLLTRRVRLPLVLAIALLMVHPAWTVSAIHGDCGFMKLVSSLLITAAYFVLLIWHWPAHSIHDDNTSKVESNADLPKNEHGTDATCKTHSP